MRSALEDIDVVFHEAAYGGYMPEMAKYVLVNSFGTAQMLEMIRDEKLPVREGAGGELAGGVQRGGGGVSGAWACGASAAAGGAAAGGRLSRYIARCAGSRRSRLRRRKHTPGGGETVYALTKVDQEKLVLLWGKQTGIPTVALRYSCTYGPRQSLYNPYTGVIAIFCTRLLNGRPPVLYEDGGQTRDLCFVEDIARANLLAAESDAVNGLPVNVGSGRATSVRDLARIIAEQLGVEIEPLAARGVPAGRDTVADLGYFAGADDDRV